MDNIRERRTCLSFGARGARTFWQAVYIGYLRRSRHAYEGCLFEAFRGYAPTSRRLIVTWNFCVTASPETRHVRSRCAWASRSHEKHAPGARPRYPSSAQKSEPEPLRSQRRPRSLEASWGTAEAAARRIIFPTLPTLFWGRPRT